MLSVVDIDIIMNFRYKPDVIKGDMDSVRAEVLEFYKNMVRLCLLCLADFNAFSKLLYRIT